MYVPDEAIIEVPSGRNRAIFQCPECKGFADLGLHAVTPPAITAVWCDGKTRAPHHEPAIMRPVDLGALV